jgi:hypothetical protein
MGRALAGLLRGAVLKVMLVLCLTSSLAACSEPPDQPGIGDSSAPIQVSIPRPLPRRKEPHR